MKPKRPLTRRKPRKNVAPVTPPKTEPPSDASSTAPGDELSVDAVDGALTELEEQVNDTHDSWETASLLGDLMDELADAEDSEEDPGDCCTPEEGAALRHQLRQVGPIKFCQQTVDEGRYTARKLLTAFGIRPPAFLQDEPDEAYFSLLSLAITRELRKRAKLARYNTVEDAAELILNSRNIICLTGAGISTSLGIPDFRSQGTGLYSKLAHLGLNDPQEVFDIEQFRADPSIFYSVAKDIIPSADRFTPTHAFIALLEKKGKLLTNYSQNIDNLEARAGISPEKLVQCHGSFATATCIRCGHKMRGELLFPDIRAGNIPRCPVCVANLRKPAKRKRTARPKASKRRRKRSADDEDDDDLDSEYDIPTAGVMKPDITFFGEALPDDFSRRLTETDRDKVDLVIVIGTSLKVTPVSEIVSYLPPHVPQIYISRMPVNHINFDIDLLGDCDVVVAELCRRMGWDLRHEMVPEGQSVRLDGVSGFPSRHVFSVEEK